MNILLIVPYNLFEAKHGNAIRVRALMETILKDGNRTSLLMYDIIGRENGYRIENVKVYFRKVRLRILAIAALMRSLFRASTYDLLCSRLEPFGGFGELVERIVEEDEIDLIQCENIWTVPPLMSAISKISKPIVVTAHDICTDRFEQLYEYQKVPKFISRRLLRAIRETEKRALELCKVCICVSEYDRRRMIEIGADPEKIEVIPNGVDASKISSYEKDREVARKFGISEGDIVLFFPGSEMFQNKKAADDILEKILPRLDSRFKMVFAGTICNYLANKKLPKGVKLAGYIEDLSQLYGLVDIVILPITVGSGTKLKTLEAMAAGKPIITTPAGSIGIRGTDEKYLWIEEKVEEFPSRIVELSRDKGLRDEMGRKARDRALEYDWNLLMKRYIDIYYLLKNAIHLEIVNSSRGYDLQGKSERRFTAQNITIIPNSKHSIVFSCKGNWFGRRDE
ncbi:MAG: glycosyltransferase family 4 protein [Thermoproteota archaeon]